jgi:nucleoside-diphosphate-sugar epimerase
MEKMNYLVTGAAGFIASRICEQLINEGHRVVGIDNLCPAYDVRMKEFRLRNLVEQPAFKFYNLDICDLSSLADIFSEEKINAVINLAARAGVRASTEDPWTFVNTNTTGTLNMLEMCRQHGINKFILASTSSIYGNNVPVPTPESASSDLVLQPYAASKKGAEAMCHAYHYLYGIDVTVFRYFTVYGPAGRPDMAMFRFIQWINEDRPLRLNGDGTQSRGFTYVDDIARGTILGLKPLGFEIINLGGHEVITINELIVHLESCLGKRARIEHLPINFADMTVNQADVSKAKMLLGWEPLVNLDEGISYTCQWYQQNRDFARQIQTI